MAEKDASVTLKGFKLYSGEVLVYRVIDLGKVLIRMHWCSSVEDMDDTMIFPSSIIITNYRTLFTFSIAHLLEGTTDSSAFDLPHGCIDRLVWKKETLMIYPFLPGVFSLESDADTLSHLYQALIQFTQQSILNTAFFLSYHDHGFAGITVHKFLRNHKTFFFSTVSCSREPFKCDSYPSEVIAFASMNRGNPGRKFKASAFQGRRFPTVVWATMPDEPMILRSAHAKRGGSVGRDEWIVSTLGLSDALARTFLFIHVDNLKNSFTFYSDLLADLLCIHPELLSAAEYLDTHFSSLKTAWSNFHGLVGAFYSQGGTSREDISSLFSSEWESIIEAVLRVSLFLATLFDRGFSIVFMSKTNGDDCALFAGLLSLFVSPNARTVTGFAELLHLHFFSCWFPAMNIKDYKKMVMSDIPPNLYFVILIDVTWHMIQLLPHSFQYGVQMLMECTTLMRSFAFNSFLRLSTKDLESKALRETPCLSTYLTANTSRYTLCSKFDTANLATGLSFLPRVKFWAFLYLHYANTVVFHSSSSIIAHAKASGPSHHLDLHGYALGRVPVSLFSKMPEVITVDLSYNVMSFCDLPKPPRATKTITISHLNVSYNNIRDIRDDPRVQVLSLDLSHNQISGYPFSFAHLSSITSLDLRDNLINHLLDLRRLSHLTELYLAGNLITALDKKWVPPPALSLLDLSRNLLSGEMSLHAELISLRSLDVSNNALTGIIFPEHSELEKLDLSENPDIALPATLARLTKLGWLSMKGNATAFRDGGAMYSSSVFSQLSLLYLDLSFCNLPAFPRALVSLSTVNTLILADNKISTFPPDLPRMSALHYLDVRHNPIQVIPVSLFFVSSLWNGIFYIDLVNVASPVIHESVHGDPKEYMSHLQEHFSALVLKDIPMATQHFVAVGQDLDLLDDIKVALINALEMQQEKVMGFRDYDRRGIVRSRKKGSFSVFSEVDMDITRSFKIRSLGDSTLSGSGDQTPRQSIFKSLRSPNSVVFNSVDDARNASFYRSICSLPDIIAASKTLDMQVPLVGEAEDNCGLMKVWSMALPCHEYSPSVTEILRWGCCIPFLGHGAVLIYAISLKQAGNLGCLHPLLSSYSRVDKRSPLIVLIRVPSKKRVEKGLQPAIQQKAKAFEEHYGRRIRLFLCAKHQMHAFSEYVRDMVRTTKQPEPIRTAIYGDLLYGLRASLPIIMTEDEVLAYRDVCGMSIEEAVRALSALSRCGKVMRYRHWCIIDICKFGELVALLIGGIAASASCALQASKLEEECAARYGRRGFHRVFGILEDWGFLCRTAPKTIAEAAPFSVSNIVPSPFRMQRFAKGSTLDPFLMPFQFRTDLPRDIRTALSEVTFLPATGGVSRIRRYPLPVATPGLFTLLSTVLKRLGLFKISMYKNTTLIECNDMVFGYATLNPILLYLEVGFFVGEAVRKGDMPILSASTIPGKYVSSVLFAVLESQLASLFHAPPSFCTLLRNASSGAVREVSIAELTEAIFSDGVGPIAELAKCVLVPDVPSVEVSYDASLRLGRGGNASVYEGQLAGKKVAVKVFHPGEEVDTVRVIRDFYMDATMHTLLQHRNIITLHGVDVKEKGVVLELAEYGTLMDYLTGESALHDSVKVRILYDIACGIEYMHSRIPAICHRDIKSPNILFTADPTTADGQATIAKLSDFGTSAHHLRPFSERVVANPTWLAPEIHAGAVYGLEVDVYALGIVAWELFSGTQFMSEASFWSEIESKVVAGERPSLPQCPAAIQTLIVSCWSQNAADRMRISSVVELLKDTLISLDIDPLLSNP